MTETEQRQINDLVKMAERLEAKVTTLKLANEHLKEVAEKAVKHAQEMESKMHSMRVEMERMKLDVQDQEQKLDDAKCEQFEGYGEWA